MTDLVNLTLKNMDCEQIAILQVALKIAGFSFSCLYHSDILSEDYVAAYGDFFKELERELVRVQTICFGLGRDPVTVDYTIDCAHIPACCEPSEKGGDDQC